MWMHAKSETGKYSVPVGPSLLEETCCYVWCLHIRILLFAEERIKFSAY